MKNIQLLIIALLTGCSNTEEQKPIELNPNVAVSIAQEKYKQHGYSPITIVANGEQYHGKENIEQETIYCAMDGKDINLYLVPVGSVSEHSAIKYTNLYNTEMMRLLAIERGCMN